MVERCPKPGCGALRKLGHPCTDWDCPQQQVHHTDYAALEAERDRLDRCLTLADERAKDSDTAAIHNAFRAATLARENDALRTALVEAKSRFVQIENIIGRNLYRQQEKIEDARAIATDGWILIGAALNPTTASKETPDAT